MNSIYTKILALCIAIPMGGSYVFAQCNVSIEDSSLMLSIPLTVVSQNTTISGSTNQDYVICPGVVVTYTGAQSVFCNFYLEPGAVLHCNTYFYPSVFMKNTSILDCGSSQPLSPMYITVTREPNAIIMDSTGSYLIITDCPTLTFEYPIGVAGCMQTYQPEIKDDNFTLKLYPQPASSEFMLDFAVVSTGGLIKVSDYTGKIVLSRRYEKTQQVKMDIRDLENGIYIISVSGDDGFVSSERLIVLH